MHGYPTNAGRMSKAKLGDKSEGPWAERTQGREEAGDEKRERAHFRREASARMTRRVSQMSEMAKSAPSQSTWPPSSAVWLGEGKLARACPRLCMRQIHVILLPAEI